MQDNEIEISEELLQNMSVDDIVDIKIEVDDLIERLDSILEVCTVALNS